MSSNNVLSIFAFFCCFIFLDAQQPTVHLPIGSLRGREIRAAVGFPYYSYQGIPYAEPPVGNLRFMAPVEKRPWGNELDATHEKTICMQMYSNRPNAKEDCLYLHVYTPVKPGTNKSLPVMFYIYGGGFITGSADYSSLGPEHLLAKDVIVVEHNYRVGSFGFFTTGDDVIPGNAGLKDQNLALKWTKKYIKYFGGDPNKITIFGHSAGSASVSYHLLSPMSQGLFRAAIQESGSAMSPWGYNRRQKQFSLDMTKAINPAEFARHNYSSRAILQYLQSFPADQVNAASTKMYYPRYNQIQHGFYFTPVIEVNHPGAFLSKRQYEQFQNGGINNVPTIMGFTSEEEIGMLTDKYLDYNAKSMEDSKVDLIPYDLKEKPQHRNEVAEIIHRRYCPNCSFVNNHRNFVKYMSDQSFTRSIHKQAELQSRYGHVWFYRFAYKGTMTGQVHTPVNGFSPDVGHGEELSYIFNNKWTGNVSRFPQPDIMTHKRLVTMWTNFAKYLNPTPSQDGVLQNIIWPQFHANDQLYLDIGSQMQVKNHPKGDDFAFWDGIYQKYGTPPYDSY